jgi:RND superfamily putative drug exporter
VIGRPRLVIGSWLLVVTVLAIFGRGLDNKLPDRPIFVPGSESKREYEVSVHQFGRNEAIIVMLRGPRFAVRHQGRELAKRLGSMPRTLVVSPWTSPTVIHGLNPAPGVAALLVDVAQTRDEEAVDLVSRVERQVKATIKAPVNASIAGRAPLLASFISAVGRAASAGERIAVPVLLVVLLLVFRSVIAAAIPIVIGGSVVAATRGTVGLLLGAVNIESFALGVVGMMGLALGVDYALLVVSRFREEVRSGGDVSTALQVTVESTGRAIVPAGAGLVLAMLVAMQVFPNPLVTSVGFVVIVVSLLSVTSAILVVPAMLAVLGTNVDRWSLPRRMHGNGAASRWSQSISRRPSLVFAVVFALLACAGWALTLNTGVGNITLLPSDDPGRQQQEAVQQALGPGWVAPIEILMDGRGRPVTEPHRLQALAAFQHQFEGDPAVATVAGVAPIEKRTRQLGRIKATLMSRSHDLSQLDNVMSRVSGGSTRAAKGISLAAGGAGRLDSAIGSASGGAESLAEGLDAVGTGSLRLSEGLGGVGRGGTGFMRGLQRVSAGAGRLAAGLGLARRQAGEAGAGVQVFKEALQAGDKRLAEIHPVLRGVTDRLAAAEQGLEQMTTGRGDAQYEATLRAVEEANERLTGRNASTGAQLNPSFNGVDAEVKLAQNQFGLGLFLTRQGRKTSEEARKGVGKLALGSLQLDAALRRLVAGGQKFFHAITRLTDGGEAISPGIERLASGANRLGTGLNALQRGAGELSRRLGGGAHGLSRLGQAVRRVRNGLEEGSTSSGAQLDNLQNRSPGLFRSGYFYLASLDGSRPSQRRHVAVLINLDRGGVAARMLVIPRYSPASSQTHALTDRLQRNAQALARKTGTDVVVGGGPVAEDDLNGSYRDQAPGLRIALMLVTALVLLFVLRSLTIPVVAAFLNLVTVAATFGLMSLLFNGSLFGGPGYVDTTVIPTTIMVMFGLALDYEIFIFARMREEYLVTGSPDAAVTNGLKHTARVVTGAATIMILVFLTFSFSPFVTIRDFGVAQALAVSVDAFAVRLVVVPALMRALGKWAWWMPTWLDRFLPGEKMPVRGSSPRNDAAPEF